MRSLFRAFERRGVVYLVISGQATVLYGAAAFSQDLDLWVEPTLPNLRKLLTALSRLKARVHKLTPPLTLPMLRRGHGFHFVVPNCDGQSLYLDVMGRPPRVGRFRAALRRAKRLHTPWGRLPVLGIEDLVEVKKTNRPGDYDVISRLVLIALQRTGPITPARLRWALGNVFRPEDTWEIIRLHGARLSPALRRRFPEAAFLDRLRCRGVEPRPEDYAHVGERLARRAKSLQDLGRAYWIPRLEELRRLRAAGALVREGTDVADLLR